MKKIAYYNMPSGIDYELELLKKWNIKDIELSEIKGEFSPENLVGFSGLVTEYTHVGEETFKKAKDLKIIALQSIGYDEIDVIAAEKYNIAVTNAPGYCAEDVATHAMALLLSSIRQTAMFDSEVKNGTWNCFAGNPMLRLSGKKAGLISFGNIPQKIVSMLKGFNVEVFAYDKYKDAEFMKEKGVSKIEKFEDILSLCDYIFIHTPLIEETHHMFNAEAFSCMKDGAILINASRGALIDEPALVNALKNKKLSAAGLDVLEDEQNRNAELIAMKNVTITPHTAFLSEDSLKQSREMALRHLVQRICEDIMPDCCVNDITL